MNVAILQLVYTNVEAPQSPTNQRGFQIWRYSPGLAAEVRKEIEQRVKDFRLPSGTRVGDEEIVRHIGFRLRDEGYVVARTVSLPELDRFGRGGRFLAHAAILTRKTFRDLMCDPFAVIDGFPFLSHLDKAMDGRERPKAEFENETTLTVKSVPQTVLPHDIEALLIHVTTENSDPIVVPATPSKVLDIVRACMRILPPSEREKIEFDTLSSGAALAKEKYKLVGGFAVEHIRLWTFKKFRLFDPATGTAKPPFAPNSTRLPAALFKVPSWATLPDNDRQAAYNVARVLASEQLVELGGTMVELTPNALDILEELGVQAELITLAMKRSRSDLPGPLADLAGVKRAVEKYYTVRPLSEALSRLANTLPPTVVTEGLKAELVGDRLNRPPPPVLDALAKWLPKVGKWERRLARVLARWQLTPTDVEILSHRSHGQESPDDESRWFHEWAERTFGPEFTGGLPRLIEQLKLSSPIDPYKLNEMQLWLALHTDESNDDWVRTRLSVASRVDAATLKRAISELRSRPATKPWLLEQAKIAIDGHWTSGWMYDGSNDPMLGFFVQLASNLDESILDSCFEIKGMLKQLFQSLWPVQIYEITPPEMRDDETTYEAPKKTNDLVQILSQARPDQLKKASANLATHLREADDHAFRWVANKYLEKMSGSWGSRAFDGATYFFGLFLQTVQNTGNIIAEREAILSAVVPEYQPGTLRSQISQPTDRTAHRFAWLLSRLANPAMTTKLKL